MKNIPRILPLVGVAAAGVLAVNALSGARALPDLVSGAKAFAEEAAKPIKGKKAPSDADKDAASASTAAVDAAAAARLPPPAKPAAICAPTAAELAKEAGLSPAELQVLQSLGARRGQLDQRENDLNTQLALMAAAEAKLDAKIKTLNGLKGDIQGLMGQADAKEASEVDRMVKVFEAMKAKDAAPRMTLLDDSVRLPIAAKMKERVLSAILAQMAPAEAKRLTESLARRFANARAAAASADKAGTAAAAAVPPTKLAAAAPPPAPESVDPTVEPDPAKAKPATKKPVAKKPAPKKTAAKKPATQTAEAKPAAAAPAAPAPAPAAAPATPAAAKSGG